MSISKSCFARLTNKYQNRASYTSIYGVYIKTESICRIGHYKGVKNFILKNPCKIQDYVNHEKCKIAGNPASKNSSFWDQNDVCVDMTGLAGAICPKSTLINDGRNFMSKNYLK